MKRDSWGRAIVTEQDVCDKLYVDPSFDLSDLKLEDPSKHNQAVKKNYSELSPIAELETITLSPEQWHASNQSHWHMPQEYRELDIASWVLEQCNGNETELQRCGHELLSYADRGLLPLLCYLKYLVDTMRANGVVWGVGRGSSVASFVLYKIGVHRINSIEYDLDFAEFMR